MNKTVELTLLSIGIGIITAIVMTAANAYLGLYAGMTVSASIPAAVVATGIFRGILRRKSVLESNIVQTMASAGETLAAGIIFTLPALVIVGAWTDFEFWPTTLIAMAGGLLGVIFMIPLRKALIVDEKELTYPEGVACASVLETGSSDDTSGLKALGAGIGLGALFKLLTGKGLALIIGSVEYATRKGGSVFFGGTDASPALLAVGYIIKLRIAFLVFLGGAIGWIIGIPLFGTPAGMESLSPLDQAWTLWSTQIRYLGVGAMIVGGLWSILSVRKGITAGLVGLRRAYKDRAESVHATEKDLGLMPMVGVLAFSLLLMLGVYNYMVGSFEVAVFSSIMMLIGSFFFVAVSSYIAGLVGTSNNPVSGMTITILLATAIFFLFLGYKGESAILATLGVAAIVCCAAATAGDCSQDLKTGYLVGATPRSQQIAQIIGVVIPAFTIAPVLSILHHGYGIGDGLKAPQATLFASIADGMFGDGNLPMNMIVLGAALGIGIIVFDEIFKRSKMELRLHVMPVAVGIYLPLTLSVPILIGGLIRYFVEKAKTKVTSDGEDRGVLVGSGLIAGEALMGVGLAVLIYFETKIGLGLGLSHETKSALSIILFALVGYAVFRAGKSKNN